MVEKGMTPEMFQQLYPKNVQERFFKAVYDAVLRAKLKAQNETESVQDKEESGA